MVLVLKAFLLLCLQGLCCASSNLRGSSEFEAVDGGEGRACRGAHSSDNLASYYVLFNEVASLAACKEKCIAEALCQGIEYADYGRCEVWTRPGGIQASRPASRTTCLTYALAAVATTSTTTTAKPWSAYFEGIDGGEGRACRGEHSSDNSHRYFKLYSFVPTLQGCEQKCFSEPRCKGIEYASRGGRCEVWTRADGVEASVPLRGTVCLAYHGLRENPGENSSCHTLLEGESCYSDTLWAMVHGIYEEPASYPAPLSPASSWEDFQMHMHHVNPDGCPAPCAPSLPTSDAVLCQSRAVPFHFDRCLVEINKKESIRYKQIGEVHGRKFDLILTPTGGYNWGFGSGSGLSGKFGKIAIKAGKTATINFSFEDSETGEAVELEAFFFSLFDLDEGFVIKERAQFTGFESFTLSSNTEVSVESSDDWTTFGSTEKAWRCGNPRDPMKIDEPVKCAVSGTIDLRDRAVTVLYAGKSTFTAKFEAKCTSRFCFGWRDFIFAGSSSLSYSCEDAPQLGLCAVFGDPHFVTFDGAHTVFMGHQAIWLVRSDDVWVQAMSTDVSGRLEAVAVGGPFMGNRTLIVRKTSPWEINAFLDGEAVFEVGSDEFQLDGVVHGFKSETWNATLHNDDVLKVRTQMQFAMGPWPERFMNRPPGGLYLFKLPENVELTVTGSDILTAVLTMPVQTDGQSGYCGNFNGDADDDFAPGAEPSAHLPTGADLGPVEADFLLFNASLWTWNSSNGSWLRPGQVLRECQGELLELAEERCQFVTDAQMKTECHMDVCATGNLSASQGILAAEIIEYKVNARGIPVFAGHGKCLDVAGQTYQAVSTNLQSMTECKDVLKSLALKRGVIGAQLQQGAPCQILVLPHTDPTSVKIKGGWGPDIDNTSVATGFISNTTGASGWQCWQLV
mmetsp:Transcript_101228/g.179811  ORF Transcript_101228/g.179811 Transcript_101228/m.179811 type:complete len:905 (+) Transcript_101228:61-2775(+)